MPVATARKPSSRTPKHRGATHARQPVRPRARGPLADVSVARGTPLSPVTDDGYVLIQTPDQWKAISSAVRFEMIEQMHSMSPCSLAELAASMGRRADGLYHHVHVLEKVGILRISSYRKRGKQIEAIYELPGSKVELDIDFKSGKNAEHFMKVTRALLRYAERKLADAVRHRTDIGSGVDRQLWARSESSWLDDSRRRRVNQLLYEIHRLLIEGRASRKGKLYHTTIFMLPVDNSTANKNSPRRD